MSNQSIVSNYAFFICFGIIRVGDKDEKLCYQ